MALSVERREGLRLESFEIQKLKPSQLNLEVAVSLHIEELITKGYGFEGVGVSAGIRALSEYDEKEERAVIYIATQDGRAVGSLVTTRWTPDDEYGKKFWADLKQKNRSLFRRLSKLSPLGINISGITTHPEFRRQGLAERVYKYLILESSPSFITGITKSPEAVIARANVLRKLGYRTFYGNTEVTPDRPEDFTNVHQNLLDADVKARGDALEESADGTGVYYIEGWLPRAIPDISKFPSYIQKAFEDVIEAQKAADAAGNNKKIAIKPLVSVRSSIRLRAETEAETEAETGPSQLPLGLFEETEPPQSA